MKNSKHSTAAAVAIALTFLLAGGALLLQELDQLVVNWVYVLALVVAAGGAVFGISGVVETYRTRSDSSMTGPRPSSRPFRSR